MGMSAPRLPTTVDEYFALPDSGWLRDELLEGVYVVSPEPTVRHQRAAMALGRLLLPALAERRDLELFSVPGNIVLGPRTVVEPDLFVIPRPSAAAHWRDVELPLLVIEILSPSTAQHDRWTKRRLYQRAGIPQYWIVDLDARIVERWRPEDDRPEILLDQIAWRPDNGGPVVFIELRAFFAEILDP
jgi:Uma2 family endonuclease